VLTTCLAHPPSAGHAMNRSHVIPGRWLSHGAMSSTGAALDWFRETHGGDALDVILSEAAASEPGAGGVLFLPYLAGERSPIWDTRARGAWVGLSLGTTRGQLARSVLEAAGFGLRQLIDLERRANGVALTELDAVGGGARSELWMRVKADITGVRFRPSLHFDAAVAGAGLLAATAAELHTDPAAAAAANGDVPDGVIEPRRDLFEGIYADLFESYRSLYPRLSGVMHALAAV
jgi:xylulokinase